MASHGTPSEIFRLYLKQQEEMRRRLKFQNEENLEQWRFNDADTKQFHLKLQRHGQEQRRLEQSHRQDMESEIQFAIGNLQLQQLQTRLVTAATATPAATATATTAATAPRRAPARISSEEE